MKKPFVIGITGGIGGGKSTFSRILREKSFLVYDTDERARILQNEDLLLVKQISELFGEAIYSPKGLNRSKLGAIVFKNPILLKKLAELVHPVVSRDFFAWKKENEKEDFLFVECAILFESFFSEFVDKTILVTAPEDVRIERVVKRDAVSAEQVRARMAHQMPEEEKMKLADIILDSSGEGALENNIEIALNELKKIDRRNE